MSRFSWRIQWKNGKWNGNWGLLRLAGKEVLEKQTDTTRGWDFGIEAEYGGAYVLFGK